MAPSVQHYFKHGLALSTQRSYDAATKRFNDFCSRFNITEPFPITEIIQCSFAAFLADQGLAPSTVKVYLSALRNLQITLGLPDPRDHSSLPRLKRVLVGISRARLRTAQKPRIRLPITAQLLTKIHSNLSLSDNPNKILIWAIASLAFFGFFRLGELLVDKPSQYNAATHLSWGDVAVNSLKTPSMIKIHLKTSKCDQLGEGVDIFVGTTGSPICPVAATIEYIRTRQDAPGAFFVDKNRKPVGKAWFTQQIRQVLRSLGLPQDDYAGHSFRIGAATSAALAGIEDSTIQTLGRWQSAAYMRYIRLSREHLASITGRLGASPPQAMLTDKHK